MTGTSNYSNNVYYRNPKIPYQSTRLASKKLHLNITSIYIYIYIYILLTYSITMFYILNTMKFNGFFDL